MITEASKMMYMTTYKNSSIANVYIHVYIKVIKELLETG